jgi:hypothetical protein
VSHTFASSTTIANSYSAQPAISADGRFIAFESPATDLIQGLIEPIPGTFIDNVYLYDATAGTTTLVSHAAHAPKQAVSNTTLNPVISDNGGFVAYQSASPSLVLGDIVATYNIYLFDRSTDDNTLVSHVASSATTSPSVESANPVISSDGNFVAFISFATNLVAGQSGTPDTTNVFLYNRQTGAITLVSGAQGSASVTGNNFSDSPAINMDGSALAFRSTASNLVAGQSGPAGSNIFLFSNQGNTTGIALVSHAAGSATTTASSNSTVPFIDGDGGLLTYLSTANDLIPGQSGGGMNNVFGWVRSNGLNFLASGQNGSPTVTSPFPAFLPIISRDPIILFSVTGTLLVTATGSVNGYANTLIDITFTPVALPDGSPAGTAAGTLATTSVLVGQLVLPFFSLPAGGAADNGRFAAGATATDGTAPLRTQFVVNAAAQSSFRVLVQADTGLGVIQRAFNLTAQPGGNVAYVARLYQDILRREADPGGLANWVGELNRRVDRFAVAAGIATSDERFGMTVDGFYRGYLRRDADPGGRAAWVAALRANVPEEQVAQAFLLSGEYRRIHPSTEGFIDGLYQDLLGRQVDPGGLASWRAVLAGPGGPAAVVEGVQNSTERDLTVVDGFYHDYLRREGDITGRNSWVAALQAHQATAVQVALAFLASDEYFHNAAG